MYNKAMKTTRTIVHPDGHADVETYMKDADGVWIWAVTQCGQKQEKQAMTEKIPSPLVPYKFEHAINMLKQAIEFGEAEGDYSRVRVWAHYVEKAHNAEVKDMQETITNIDEGAKLMHSLATGGEGRLDADLAAMLQWEDEKPTREPYTDRKVTVPQTLRSYATYKNAGKARPLSAEEVDGEGLGE